MRLFLNSLQRRGRLSDLTVRQRQAFAGTTAAVLILTTVAIGLTIKPGTHAAGGVPGQNYQICGAQASTYLTSPWTYHALSSGSQTYTVAQYKAVSGYGTTLPPLPDYMANMPASTEAATIFAPTSADTYLAGYQIPGTPELFFFEGGNYGGIALPSVSGDQFIGGSTTGFPEPVFNDAGNADGIGNNTAHFGFEGGSGTGTGSAGSSTLTTNTSGVQGNAYLTFSDGSNYHVTSVSGSTLTLSPALSSAKSSATFWYNNFNSGNGGLNQLAEVSATAAQGATQLSIGGWSGNQISQPFVTGERIVIGDDSAVNNYTVSAVTGTQAGGYTLTLDAPLAAAAATGTPIWYYDLAGGVTVQYLNIGSDVHGTTGTITAGKYWTIEHNNIHDGYAGGANYANTSATGIAIDAADYATIQYNCFQRMGEYALNGGGVGSKFNYNQVDKTPYQPDLSGNGQSGCGKWWGSMNNDIVGNAFTDERYSVCLWFDNGNAGMLVQGNYFYNINSRAIQNETGWNSMYDNNLFQNVDSAIYQNDSGGWDIPGSRYNNQIVMQNNTFYNVKEGINIWGASGRSCLSSGEALSNGESSPYCSGGFPQMHNGTQYFSHNLDSVTGTDLHLARAQSCSSAAPCATITLNDAPTQNEWIGFNGLAPNAGASAAAATTTSDTTNVTSTTTLHVPSTSGFPGSGQLVVATNKGGPYGATGAILAYSGTTAGSFTGVTFVSGAGTLVSGGAVIAVQPHHVTAVNCPGGNCTNKSTVTISPAITTNLAAGTDVYATGTCQYYDTVAATATSPLAPNGTSYLDGCMWENRNISVTGNTFYLNAAQFAAVPLPEGEGGNWTCTTGAGGDCGTNTMGYQYPGTTPYDNVSFSNAMMSHSSLPAPYNNLNASGSPLTVGTNNDVGPNPETPYNNIWSGNTYLGDWRFQAYVNAAACPVDWTGTALKWNGGTSGNACSDLTVAQWQSYWKQDAGATSNPSPSPLPAFTPPPTGTGTPTPSASPTPTSTPAGKIGDLNNDGAVNIFDLSILLSDWSTANAAADLNHDSTVNIFDLSILLSHWGT